MDALSAAELRQFEERGFVVLSGAFSREHARAWAGRVAPTGEPYETLDWTKNAAVERLAPRAWSAIVELLGGVQRLPDRTFQWTDGFVVNRALGAGEPWEPHQTAPARWHDWHLDGLGGEYDAPLTLGGRATVVVLSLWSDVGPRGGATVLACDSLPACARLIASRPEGVAKKEVSAAAEGIVPGCRDFVELTGRAGDVALVHPFVLHARSQNFSGQPRVLLSSHVWSSAPMRLDGGSPVERAVARALK